uniref:Glycosyltransferase 2-like domain-containing protein n=1 Tax=Acrobeloides nanus TaxID=290746 RepID=A0A914CK16_9BILA
MEEGTPDKEEKARHLKAIYMAKFERFYVTVHPKGLSGDIPGKCSNFNYGSRMAIKYLKEDRSYGLDENTELMVTTGDCDTIFGERYFDALEEDYLKLTPEQRSITVWQSPLFYCINIDKSPFFVRNVGLLRSFFMMGYLIPWNINTMSVFSLTLKLYEDGEYTHPGYQMDDIIALIRWMCVTGKRCVVRPIPVATLSGPTSGKNYFDEFYEWARQIRSWTIGAAEVFHYFAIKSKKLPFFVSLTWASRFIFYYGFLLCIASCYGIITPFVTVAMLKVGHHPAHGIVIKDEWTFNWIMLGCLGLQYVCHNASKKDGLLKTGGPNAVHPITDKNPDRFDV